MDLELHGNFTKWDFEINNTILILFFFSSFLCQMMSYREMQVRIVRRNDTVLWETQGSKKCIWTSRGWIPTHVNGKKWTHFASRDFNYPRGTLRRPFLRHWLIYITLISRDPPAELNSSSGRALKNIPAFSAQTRLRRVFRRCGARHSETLLRMARRSSAYYYGSGCLPNKRRRPE